MVVTLIICFKDHTWEEHSVRISKRFRFKHENELLREAKKKLYESEKYKDFYCAMINSYGCEI